MITWAILLVNHRARECHQEIPDFGVRNSLGLSNADLGLRNEDCKNQLKNQLIVTVYGKLGGNAAW